MRSSGGTRRNYRTERGRAPRRLLVSLVFARSLLTGGCVSTAWRSGQPGKRTRAASAASQSRTCHQARRRAPAHPGKVSWSCLTAPHANAVAARASSGIAARTSGVPTFRVIDGKMHHSGTRSGFGPSMSRNVGRLMRSPPSAVPAPQQSSGSWRASALSAAIGASHGRGRRLGELNPAWRGGVADWEYSPDWKAIARKIRFRDRWTCQDCGEYRSNLGQGVACPSRRRQQAQQRLG